ARGRREKCSPFAGQRAPGVALRGRGRELEGTKVHPGPRV
ncbi:MAG: hypothetical protein AVDCRST_MAG25-99, partial [uncultured Rubrobacteraceae bacterium]